MNEYQEVGCSVRKLFSGYVVAVCYVSSADAELFCLAFAVLYLYPMFLCLKILFVLSLLVLKFFSSMLLVCLL